VLSSDVFGSLGLPSFENEGPISGIGGPAESVLLQTDIRLEGPLGKMTLRGVFAAATEPETLDMSLLGRDILDMFSLLVDRPNDLVVLVCQQHVCTIELQTAG
jgi:hypothetical protein